ncbi:MAG: acyl carrier protein [Spongiibacteraceae bacterium]
MDIAEIRNIVIEEAQLRIDAQTISDTTDLDDAGITSLGRMNVILALEDRFQITFPDEMMTRKNFASITAVSKTINALVSKVCGVIATYIPIGWLDFLETAAIVA